MKRRVEKLSATVFGLGYLPVAPGTWASLAAVCAWYFLNSCLELNPAAQIACISLTLIIGTWACIRLEKIWESDPSQIVIDEWAGMWITCFLLPVTWQVMLLAFIVFRVLDIWKPLYIRKAEKIKGGWGVMMDDVMAGIIGNLFVHVVLWI